jgi:hypothetical protein
MHETYTKQLTLKTAGIICLDDGACSGFCLERLSSVDQDGFFKVHFLAGNNPDTSNGPGSEPPGTPGFAHYIKQPGAVRLSPIADPDYALSHESSISLANIIATDDFGVRGNDGMVDVMTGSIGTTGFLAAAYAEIKELEVKLASNQDTTSQALVAQKLAEQDAKRAQDATHAQILKVKAMTTELKRLYVSEAVFGAKLEHVDSKLRTGFRQAFKNAAKVILTKFHANNDPSKESQEQFEEFEKFICILIGVGIVYAICTRMVHRSSSPLSYKGAMLPQLSPKSRAATSSLTVCHKWGVDHVD